jgi:gliding motility-associated-like protein
MYMKLLIGTAFLFFSINAIAQCNGTEPQIDLGNDTILCAGQTLELNAPSGFNYYSWSNGSSADSLLVSSAGEYSVAAGIVGPNLVLNGNFQGGTTAASNNFTTAYAPGTGGSYGLLSNPGTYAISTSPNLVHNNFLVCGDHTSGTGNMLIANGASTANTTVWSQTVPVTPGTNYVFSFWQTNVLNATEVSNLQLYINNIPISTIVPTLTTACSWQQNDGVWNAGAATSAILSIVNQSVLSSGNDFAIDDILFAPVCIVADTIVVEYDTIQVNAGTDIQFCANESENLTATANVAVTDWSWSSGEATAQITPLTAGTYTVTGTSVNGCTTSDAVNVAITAMNWDIDQVIMGPSDCGVNNGYVSVMTSGTFSDPPSYNWSGPGPNSTNDIDASVFTDLSPGWYYLVIESDGCYRYDSVQVVPNNPPVAGLSATPLSGIYPLTVDFTNSSQNSSDFTWSFGNGNTANTTDLTGQTQTYDTTGVYTVMLVAANGSCSDTAYVTIVVNEPPVIPPTVPVSVETSNVFTPNGDGVNDVYAFKLENITELDLVILNRWGQVMFESTDLVVTWNGKTLIGLDAPAGVYFYTYKAVGAQQEQFEGHGFIHLVK